MRDAKIFGLLALLAVSVMAKPRKRELAAQIGPAPEPPISPQPEPLIAAGHVPMHWALVQTVPTTQLLAVSFDRDRLAFEANELVRIYDESSDPRDFRFMIVPVDALPNAETPLIR